MTVLERLKELQAATEVVDAHISDYIERDEYAGHNLPTLLALAEVCQRIDSDMRENCDNTVGDKDKADMRAALAELEKEAQ